MYVIRMAQVEDIAAHNRVHDLAVTVAVVAISNRLSVTAWLLPSNEANFRHFEHKIVLTGNISRRESRASRPKTSRAPVIFRL